MPTTRAVMGLISSGATTKPRDWLDAHLFIAAPSPRPIRPSRMLAGFAIVALLIGAQLLRMSGSAPLNSIWAEDGTRWLSDALRQSLGSALRTPYDGYLQTSSRLIAQPISHLPASSFAAAMAIAGAVVVSGCACVIWTVSAGHIRSGPLRIALSALVVLAPMAGVEMLDNVTNTIWYLTFMSFWLLLWRPATKGRTLGAAGLLTLTALSTVGVIFMFPLWLLRVIAVRTGRDLAIVAALPLGLAFQVSPLAHYTAGQAHAGWNWDLLPGYVQRVVAGSVLGDRLAGMTWTHIGVALEVAAAVALLAFVVYAVSHAHPPARALVLIAVFTSLLSFLGSGYDRGLGPQLLWRAGTDPTVLTRYCVVPGLLLLTGVLVLVDDLLACGHRRAWSVALAWLTVAAVTSFSVGVPTLRGVPRYSTTLQAARATCATGRAVAVIRVSPIYFSPMQAPCRRLR